MGGEDGGGDEERKRVGREGAGEEGEGQERTEKRKVLCLIHSFSIRVTHSESESSRVPGIPSESDRVRPVSKSIIHRPSHPLRSESLIQHATSACTTAGRGSTKRRRARAEAAALRRAAWRERRTERSVTRHCPTRDERTRTRTHAHLSTLLAPHMEPCMLRAPHTRLRHAPLHAPHAVLRAPRPQRRVHAPHPNPALPHAAPSAAPSARAPGRVDTPPSL
jgi:hypothetical protein